MEALNGVITFLFYLEDSKKDDPKLFGVIKPEDCVLPNNEPD